MSKSLTIEDRIYGSFNITEPVLLDLIESPALERLKRINQFGMPKRFYPYPGFSRYEHSVGVMLLLRKLGANLEEQSAGLLHDVSHTAFSHLVDWVIGNRTKEDHQDRNLQKVIFNSEIPEILEKNGFNPKRVSEMDQYSLLEMPAPELCADRVDYALREFNTWAAPEIVKPCIEDLVNYKGKIVFKTKDIAEKFGRTYGKCQTEHWGGAECTIRWELLANALKISLKKGLIESGDFYLEDEILIKRIEKYGNREVKRVLTLLEKPSLNLQENLNNPQFNLKKKFRYVDPSYLERGSIQRLSENNKEYKEFLETQRSINEKGIKVNLIG